VTAELRLAKMSAAGNDFVVLEREEFRRLGGSAEDWIRRICRRGLSVGADGVLLLERLGEERVGVTFHNPDGSEAFCGNATRCAARFARLRGWASGRMVLATAVGDVPAEAGPDGVRIELPGPTDLGVLEIGLAGQPGLRGQHVIAGVPHFVLVVDEVTEAPLERWGPYLRRHPSFGPSGTNVDVISAGQDGSTKIRTWERGVEAETLACGSGAVAAALVVRIQRGATTTRLVPASGVPLDVELVQAGERSGKAILAGDARLILEGRVGPEATTGF